MRGVEDGHRFVLEHLREHGEDFGAHDGIDPRRGLVEERQTRSMRERGDQGELDLIPLGESLDLRRKIQLESRGELLGEVLIPTRVEAPHQP